MLRPAASYRAAHRTIWHAKKYVADDGHSDTVESGFPLLKRGIVGASH